MLVVSRKNQQSVFIGDSIEIKVLHIRPGLVRLGISAPDDMRCLRAELPEAPQPLISQQTQACVMPDRE